MPLVFVTLRNKITMAYLFQNLFIIIQTMNHVETHILATIWKAVPSVLNWLRFYWSLWDSAEDASLLLKMTGLENCATFPPIRNSTDSNELLSTSPKFLLGILLALGNLSQWLWNIWLRLPRSCEGTSLAWVSGVSRGKGGKILARPDTQVRTSRPLLVHLSLSYKIYWSFL